MAGKCKSIETSALASMWEDRVRPETEGMPASAKTQKVIQTMSKGSSPLGQREKLGEMGS